MTVFGRTIIVLSRPIGTPIETPRVRGSIPRLATSISKRFAHSSEWAFCYLALLIGRRGVGALEILDADRAGAGLCCCPMAIRQVGFPGTYQMAAVGVRGVRGQGGRGVGEAGMGQS
jgi:hypothetical protein